MKNVILLFFGICILSNCKKSALSPVEELKMIGMEMAKKEHVEYLFSHKVFFSYTNDSSSHRGKMYFETNPKDTAIGYNFYRWLFDLRSNFGVIDDGETFYNGNHIISLMKRDSSVRMKPLCDYRDGHMTVYQELEKSYGAIKLFLTDTLFTSMTNSLTRKDTVLNKQPCVMFSFWADNKLIDTHKKRSGKSKVKLIFRKSDIVPLLYSTYSLFGNGKTIYYEVSFSDYRFDVTYPPSMFAIENIPAHYQWNKNMVKTIPVGTKAPDWKLPVVNGDSIALSDFRGKYVLLDFWFLGCGACIESIPVLNELKSKYEGKMEVVGVNCFCKNAEAISRYVLERGMNYMSVWNGDDKVSKMYEINGAPIFYLIDQNGVIVNTLIGANMQGLKSMIAAVL